MILSSNIYKNQVENKISQIYIKCLYKKSFIEIYEIKMLIKVFGIFSVKQQYTYKDISPYYCNSCMKTVVNFNIERGRNSE